MKKNKFVRLIELEINNIKNVKNGKIKFINNNLKDKDELELGDVLGVYGQNGSGKTALIEVLGMLKIFLSGINLNKELCELISIEEKEAKLFFKFYINYDNEKYIVEYYVFLEKEKECVEIKKEKIMYSIFEKNKWSNKKILVEYPYKNNILGPKGSFENLFKNSEEIINLKVSEKMSKKMKTSFIFSNETLKSLIKTKSENKNLINILFSLIRFGRIGLFVVTNKELALINLNYLLPLKIINNRGSGSVPIAMKKESPDILIINEEIYEDIEKSIEYINIVLKKIIPGMTLKLFKQKNEAAENGKINIIAELISIKEGKEVPLRNESEGIKRIISVLSVMIAAYNNKNICLAIDEIDSGIFEYLLGELLKIFSQNLEGQLIFTSHNLRILEKIKKESIVFTTTNPKNRYAKLKYIKPNNNVRDFYLRELIVNEQEEEFYKETDSYDIKRALYKAGDFNEEKRK